jgi:hypothetical protein
VWLDDQHRSAIRRKARWDELAHAEVPQSLQPNRSVGDVGAKRANGRRAVEQCPKTLVRSIEACVCARRDEKEETPVAQLEVRSLDRNKVV